jgi:hypothetical protein
MTLHPATFDYLAATEKMKATMERVRAAAKVFADVVQEELPEGPDKTHTLRQLRTTAFWANVAITRHPDGSPRED